MPVVIALKTEAGGGIGLGIAVDQEDVEAFQRQTGCEVDGRGGLANSALLIDYAKNLAHGYQDYRESGAEDSDLRCGERAPAVESGFLRWVVEWAQCNESEGFPGQCAGRDRARAKEGNLVENFCDLGRFWCSEKRG